MKATSDGPTRQKWNQRRRGRREAGVKRRGRAKEPLSANAGIVSEAALGRLIETVEQLAGVLGKFKDGGSGPPPRHGNNE